MPRFPVVLPGFSETLITEAWELPGYRGSFMRHKFATFSSVLRLPRPFQGFHNPRILSGFLVFGGLSRRPRAPNFSEAFPGVPRHSPKFSMVFPGSSKDLRAHRTPNGPRQACLATDAQACNWLEVPFQATRSSYVASNFSRSPEGPIRVLDLPRFPVVLPGFSEALRAGAWELPGYRGSFMHHKFFLLLQRLRLPRPFQGFDGPPDSFRVPRFRRSFTASRGSKLFPSFPRSSQAFSQIFDALARFFQGS